MGNNGPITAVDVGDETTVETRDGPVWEPPEPPAGAELVFRKPCWTFDRETRPNPPTVRLAPGDTLVIHYFGSLERIRIESNSGEWSIEAEGVESRYEFSPEDHDDYVVFVDRDGGSVDVCLWVIR